MSTPRFVLAVHPALFACLVLAVSTVARAGAAISAPFPIQSLPRGANVMREDAWTAAPVIRSASEDGRLRAEAQLLHDEQALYLRARVEDATRVFASRETVALGEAHFHDSVEFWIGRHQFALAPIGGSDAGEVVLYDYLRAKPTELESQKLELHEDGYALIVRLPWAILEQDYAPRRFFQFALSFVDFEIPPAGPGVRRARRQIWAPADLKVDRPVTYGAAFLNDTLPAAACSPVLAPLFVPEVEIGAFFPHHRLFLYPSEHYAGIAIHTRVVDADGAARFERSSRLDGETLAIDLPPGKTAGVERLDFHVAFAGGGRFGPVSLEFFSTGEKPLRDYRSERRAPEDFDAFWEGALEELAREPMEPEKRWLRGDEKADLWQVNLRGWRGERFNAYLSVPKAEGRFPVFTSVYPAAPVNLGRLRLDGRTVVLWVSPRGTESADSLERLRRSLYVTTDPDPKNFYLLANVLDFVRGIDCALAEEKADPARVFVSGGSRGGYLALALAAVDPRITLATAAVPAYANVELKARLGVSSAAGDVYLGLYGGDETRRGQMRRIWSYFDAIFFAERVRCAVVVEAGLRDQICPAPGIVDVFNRIPSGEKHLVLNPEHGHNATEIGGALRRLLQ